MCVPQHITGESKKLEGIVEELLGADLMEHNILHKGIGVTETLETLARSAFGQMSYFFVFSIQCSCTGVIRELNSENFVRFHDVTAGEQPTDPQWSYFQAN